MRLASPYVWLAVSVVANAVLTGVLVGGTIAHSRSLAANWPEHRSEHPHPPLLRRHGREALSPETRRALRRDLAIAWRQAAAERSALDDARAEFGEAVNHEPIDEAELKAALGRLRSARAALVARTEDVIIARIADLPVSTRENLLHLIETLPAGPRWGRGRDRHHGDQRRGEAKEHD